MSGPRDSGRGTLNLGAAVEIVGKHGAALEKSGGAGWATVKALVYLVGCEDWNAAAQLADALGVHPDDQQAIHHQTQREATR